MSEAMTLIEKILAQRSGKPRVDAGEIVVADVDAAVMHEMSCWSSGHVFENQVGGAVSEARTKVVVFDHLFSPPGQDTAEMLAWNREFCARHGLTLFDCGNGNLHHALIWNGFVRPGSLVVGSDSHSSVHGAAGAFGCSLGNDVFASMVLRHSKAWFRVPYRARVILDGWPRSAATARDVALWLTAQIGEGSANYAAIRFMGDYIDRLSFWDRWLFPLISVDVGAKCGYVVPDDTALEFLAAVLAGPPDVVVDDPSVEYGRTWRFDVSDVEPQLAAPPTVGNVAPVSAHAGRRVDYADLGGHGGGRIEDFREVADALARIDAEVRVPLNLVPSSRAVFRQAMDEGLVEQLFARGASWFPPSTGANQSFNMGALSSNDAMISTQARNFPGRNGSPDGAMYLGSARTVALSAAAGVITDPSEVFDS